MATVVLKPRKTIELADELGYVYRKYAHYTLLDRAIADVRDGFKPVHRRIIYAMGEMNLSPTAQHRKSARVVGEVLGKYHPHGDQSVYDALARMAQDFSLRDVLVDGQGNFGSVDGDAPAAMRYTEVRMSALGAEILRDIDMDTVDWQENFDNSLKEPAVLPAAFPNILVNGSSGIAVGFAARLPSHNLGEVCDGVTLMCNKWRSRAKIAVDDLMKAIPGPDFPTGGLVFRYRLDRRGSTEARTDAIRGAYDTGSAGIVCQARMSVEQGNGRSGDRIVISEIPYGQQKSTIIARIAKEAREGKIAGVTDIVDESDREGMRIVVQVSRQADANVVLEMLVRRSALRATFGVNNLVLAPRDAEDEQGNTVRIVEPQILGLKEMLEQFVLHRLEIIQRRSRYELARRKHRLHIIEGLLIALDNIDEIVDIIRRSRTADTARKNLMRKFRLTEVQAIAILDMQLRRLAAMERHRLQDERKELEARIKYLETLLASESKQLSVIKKETTEIKKKYATPRRTTIVDAAPGERKTIVTQEALSIPDVLQMVAVTTQGIQRCDVTEYNYRVRVGVSSRAVVAHRMRIQVQPDESVLMVSSTGQAWHAPVGLVPKDAMSGKAGLSKDAKIVWIGVYDDKLDLIMGTAQGKVKRTALANLEGQLVEKVWNEVIRLSRNDRVVFAGLCGEKGEVLFFTHERALRTHVTEIGSQQTPSARGVIGIKLDKSDTVIGGAVLSAPKQCEVFILSKTGYFKRLLIGQFTLQGRGGKGLQALKVSKSTGPAVAATACKVTQAVQVDVLAADGKRQRVALKSIPRVRTRASQGKKLVTLADPNEIVLLS